MKKPSKNISTSLGSQSVMGRGTFTPMREEMGGSPSMIVPGEGTTSKAPHAMNLGPGSEGRSAAAAADAMGDRGKMK